MLNHYFKSSWRNIRRNTLFSSVNIVGLAIGLTGFIVLLLYLNYEKSYDTWHTDLSRTYKVEMENSDGIMWNGRTQAPLASFLKQNYPKVQAATRISSNGSSDFEMPVDANGKKMYQKGVIEVDSLFFTVFPYRFVYGNSKRALQAPDAIVLEENLAKNYFGNEDPIGKPVSLYGGLIKGTITGVIQSPSTPSVLNARILMRSAYEKSNNHWQNYSYETYVKLIEPVSPGVLAGDINSIYKRDFLLEDKSKGDQPKRNKDLTYFTEKFTELHTSPKSGGSNLAVINVLLILAASLLVAGAINFSNLSLADAFRRAKEVGVKKVLGAGRGRLFVQFIIDVALQVFISLLLAALLAMMILPWFQNQFNIQLSFLQPGVKFFYAQIAFCLLTTIIIAGAYPALQLSGFNPVKIFKGSMLKEKRGFSFRNTLTVFQFVLSGFFIISSLVIFKQVKFMQSKDKGFSGNQVLRIQATQPTREQNFDKTRQQLLSVPGVVEVAKTTTVPGDAIVDTSTTGMKWNGTEVKMNEVKVSKEYFKLIGAALKEGRWFDGRYADEHTMSVIVNEAAAKRMAIASPVGQTIRFPYCDSIPVQIIGVVKDFNIQGLNMPVQPAMFNIGNFACGHRSGGAILVKINARHTQQTLSDIERLWKSVEPEFPLRYGFLNENFQKLYAGYLRIQQVVSYFTIVAILIAIMGLFAMSVFLVKEKTKELGIRKVLGAGVKDIFKVTSMRFLLQVTIAMAIAIPIGWIATQNWLQNFAYRFDLDFSVFLIASVILITIALITVSFQAIKAAVASPVKSLRTE